MWWLWVFPLVVGGFGLWILGSFIYDLGYSKAYWERTEQIDRLLGRNGDD